MSTPRSDKTINRVKRLMERFGNCCVYCGRECHLPNGDQYPYATRDHRIPKSKGGRDAQNNIVLACDSCNLLKGDMDEEDFIEELISLGRAILIKYCEDF